LVLGGMGGNPARYGHHMIGVQVQMGQILVGARK
jgi:hypothetical protein